MDTTKQVRLHPNFLKCINEEGWAATFKDEAIVYLNAHPTFFVRQVSLDTYCTVDLLPSRVPIAFIEGEIEELE